MTNPSELTLPPQISVIVPYFNDWESALRCVEALLNQNTSRTYEIIVVDDGSDPECDSDRIKEYLPQPSNVKVIKQKHGGPAAARNTGAAQAQGQYLLFTDSDCIPDPDWLEQMCNPLDRGASGVKGIYHTEQVEWVARLVQAEYEEKYHFMARFESIDFIDTYSAGFKADVFHKHGGFCERFHYPSVEDQEFSFRLSADGELMVFQPMAIVHHRHANTLWKYVRKKFRIAYYKALILRLHPKRAKGDTHTPPSLILQLPLVVLFFGSLLLTLGWPWALGVSFVTILLFLWTCRSTLSQVRQSAPDLVIHAPFLMMIRATALAIGLGAGLIRFYLAPLPLPRR